MIRRSVTRKHVLDSAIASMVLASATLLAPGVAAGQTGGCVVVENPTPENHTTCRNMDLTDISFANRNLAYADFTGSRFSFESFVSTDLRGAVLDDAVFAEGVNLAFVNLQGASLRRAELRVSFLAGTDATGADLTDADLTDSLFSSTTTFAGAVLDGADFSGTLMLRSAGIELDTFMPANVVVVSPAADGATATWRPPLSLPGATAGPCDPPSGTRFPMGITTVTCTIDDDHGTQATATFDVDVQAPAPPVARPGGATVVEGDSGTTVAEVPVTLSNPFTEPITIDWQTIVVAGADETQADPATDYVASSGTLTFPPGQTVATAAIPVGGDRLVEPDELLAISVSEPTNATVGGFWGLGFGSILDDDAQP